MPSTWRWNSLKSVAQSSIRAAKPPVILPMYSEGDRAEIERGSLLALKGQQKMLYVVLFEDEPSRTTMRAQHMSDHLAFLERNAHSVRSAGPLVDAVDESGAGACGCRGGESSRVQALYQSDPFWATGLRKSVRVLRWNQVFADGNRMRVV